VTDPTANIDPQWVIDTNTANIVNGLAPYDAVTATLAWFDTLRAIEECINLPTADWDDDEFEERLYNLALPSLLSDPRPLLALRPKLVAKFSETFANRFQNLMIQGATIGTALRHHRLFELTEGFLSVGTMIGYFQSRRDTSLPCCTRSRQPAAGGRSSIRSIRLISLCR